MAKIQLNGKKISLKIKFISVQDLLKKYKLNNKKVAIELNGVIIPKIKYKKRYLKNKDIIEIVHFIGGGKAEKRFFKIGNKNSRFKTYSWNRQI